MPEISLPDIKLPDVKFRDGRLRDVKLPDIDLRDRLPDVDLTKLSLPSALRDLSMPDVHDMHLPHMTMPDALRDLPTPSMPDLAALGALRDVRAPKVELPDVDLRSLDPRRLDLSGVDPKRLRAIAPFAKPAPKPSSPLPWVVVAAVAGMFAGWWLATSSATGPAVRSFATRMRGRIDDWRAGRSEWDDAEERSQGFWGNETGWKQEGTHAGGGPADGSAQSDEAASTSDAATWEGSASAAAMGGDSLSTGSDEGIGGAGYEPPSGDFGSESGEREG